MQMAGPYLELLMRPIWAGPDNLHSEEPPGCWHCWPEHHRSSVSQEATQGGDGRRYACDKHRRWRVP